MSPARISMGEMDFGRLANMRHVLDLSWANAERTMDLDVGHALTARRMDEAQVAGPRVYIGAHLHLLNAMDKYLREFVAMPEFSKRVGEEIARSQADVESVYLSEATALNLTYGQAKQPINVTEELPRLDATKAIGPESMAIVPACWRVLSGSQHGLPYALLHNSNIQVQAPVPGGQRVLASMKDEAFELYASVTLWLVWQACDRLTYRCTHP